MSRKGMMRMSRLLAEKDSEIERLRHQNEKLVAENRSNEDLEDDRNEALTLVLKIKACIDMGRPINDLIVSKRLKRLLNAVPVAAMEGRGNKPQMRE